MSNGPVLPRMLQKEQLDFLNAYLVEKTGCFAFLKTDQVLFSVNPRSWQDAYTIFSIGLYVVYHDYGCRFLYNLLLSDALCPAELPFPKRFRSHVMIVNRKMRTNLAHGLFTQKNRISLQRHLMSYLPPEGRAGNPNNWPDFINHLPEQGWESITRRLINDSNALYQYLLDWGKHWADHPDDLPALREKFVSYENHFNYSFDDRICRPLLLECGVESDEIKRYTNKDSSDLAKWRKNLSAYYRGGMTSPEKLYSQLSSLIQESVNPTEKSSDAIGEEIFGF